MTIEDEARAEAEKRYRALQPDAEELTYPRSALREFKRGAFVQGYLAASRREPSDTDELDRALTLLADVVVRAIPDGEDDDGFVRGYVQGTGAIHAAIPFLDHYGLHVRPGFDFRNDPRFTGIKHPRPFDTREAVPDGG